MNICYRFAQPDDLPYLVDFLAMLFSLEEDFTFSADKQQKGLHMLLQSERSTIFVAHDDHNLVGRVTGQITISTAEGGPSLLIEDLVVTPSHRNMGIGKTLLEHVSNWGIKHKAKRKQLLADRSNRVALDFYGHNDWATTNLICLRKYESSCLLQPQLSASSIYYSKNLTTALFFFHLQLAHTF